MRPYGTGTVRHNNGRYHALLPRTGRIIASTLTRGEAARILDKYLVDHPEAVVQRPPRRPPVLDPDRKRRRPNGTGCVFLCKGTFYAAMPSKKGLGKVIGHFVTRGEAERTLDRALKGLER